MKFQERERSGQIPAWKVARIYPRPYDPRWIDNQGEAVQEACRLNEFSPGLVPRVRRDLKPVMTQAELDSCNSWQEAIVIPQSETRRWDKTYVRAQEREISMEESNFLGIPTPPPPEPTVALKGVGKGRGKGSSR